MDRHTKTRPPAVSICIYHDAIARVRESLPSRDLRRREQQMTEHLLLVLFGLIERIKVRTRDHKNVRRCLRAEIVKSNAHVVLVHPLARNLASDDLAEDA